MTKTKSKAYSFLAALSIVLSANIGAVLASLTFYGVFTRLDYGLPHSTTSVFYDVFCIVLIVTFCALIMGITYVLCRLIGIAINRMLNQFHSVRYELPQSYIMPDGVSCLNGPKITLHAALKAKREMREDETVFFCLSC